MLASRNAEAMSWPPVLSQDVPTASASRRGFFTPWHAVLYSGFVAVAGWLVAMVWRRRGRGRPIWTWAPAGYGLGLLAVGVFAVGGVCDLLWHLAFGIEQGIEAELSPTHLVLVAAPQPRRRIHVWLGLVVFTAVLGALFAALLRPWPATREHASVSEGLTVSTVTDDRRS
jgi:hypothetical protein